MRLACHKVFQVNYLACLVAGDSDLHEGVLPSKVQHVNVLRRPMAGCKLLGIGKGAAEATPLQRATE